MALGIGVAFCQASGAVVARLREPCVLKVSPESKRRVVECSVLLGSRQEKERNPELESSRAALWSSRVATVLNQRFRERMEAREGIEMEGPLIRLAETSSTVEAAIVLVFGAGTCQCLDAICAKLRAVRAGGGIGFCIATKPFRFEGQRRLDKAERSLATLKAAADLLLVIDHETLLTRDGLTVMEATCLSNIMVSLGVQAVSQLISGQTSFFYDGTTEFSISEMILRLWGAANVRLGSGISLTEAVKEALDMVPVSETERQGPIICALTNSKRVRKDEMRTAARILRSVSKTEATIACFSVLDTSLAPGTHHVLLMTTRMETVKDNLIGKVVYPSTRQDSRGHCQTAPTSSSTFTENFLAKNSSSTSRENTRANGTSVTETHIDSKAQRTFPTASTSDKECRSWESGPFSDSARAWAQSRLNEPRQPGRVREIRQTQANSYMEPHEANKVNALQPLPYDPAAVPNTGVLRMGIDAVLEACRTASELIQDKDRNRPEQSLSERAACMLENERSPRSLSPSVEMNCQGGSYKGRCEGGQPDGKGRWTFADGSFYDGDWVQGKRNGMGTLYYANGDVYQGHWRDNLIHGKGWFYFHSGDRLHAEFVQGRAHGQGRYYSADGSVLFGHFWKNSRHGECIFCDSSGSRWCETWDSGVLVSRQIRV